MSEPEKANKDVLAGILSGSQTKFNYKFPAGRSKEKNSLVVI